MTLSGRPDLVERIVRCIGHDSCCSISDTYDRERFGKVCDCELEARARAALSSLRDWFCLEIRNVLAENHSSTTGEKP